MQRYQQASRLWRPLPEDSAAYHNLAPELEQAGTVLEDLSSGTSQRLGRCRAAALAPERQQRAVGSTAVLGPTAKARGYLPAADDAGIMALPIWLSSHPALKPERVGEVPGLASEGHPGGTTC